MRKSSYLRTVHLITEDVRNHFGSTYARVYSEPRKTTGYTTKLWDCEKSKSVAKFINKNYSDVVVAEAYDGGSNGWEYENVRITPLKRIRTK